MKPRPPVSKIFLPASSARRSFGSGIRGTLRKSGENCSKAAPARLSNRLIPALLAVAIKLRFTTQPGERRGGAGSQLPRIIEIVASDQCEPGLMQRSEIRVCQTEIK